MDLLSIYSIVTKRKCGVLNNKQPFTSQYPSRISVFQEAKKEVTRYTPLLQIRLKWHSELA